MTQPRRPPTEPRRSRWTCECAALNPATATACDACGLIRPLVALRTLTRVCPSDDETLRADGFCVRGHGYPLDLRCPFACTHCRGPLTWSGGCHRCHGSVTAQDRPTWTVPGDRYEVDDDHGCPVADGKHWVLFATGPRPVSRPSSAEWEVLRNMIERVGTLGAHEPAAPHAKAREMLP